MRIFDKKLKSALFAALLIGVLALCAILYTSDFYHNFEFHPIPQHEPQTPAPEAH